MLIKGKKHGPTPPNNPAHGGEGDAVDNLAAFPPPVEEPAVVWNEDTVASGNAPDRRKSRASQERRRSYRRIEDKELISKAVEEAEVIREQARQEGFSEGLKQSEAIVGELRDAIAKLLNAREDALISAADEIGALSVRIAEQIIKTEVTCDQSLVVTLVKDTIEKAGRNLKTVLVKVHPDDVAIVKEGLKNAPIPHLKAEVIIMEDSTVDSGSCIVETNSGLVDASFSTQVEVLKQMLGVQDTPIATSDLDELR